MLVLVPTVSLLTLHSYFLAQTLDRPFAQQLVLSHLTARNTVISFLEFISEAEIQTQAVLRLQLIQTDS